MSRLFFFVLLICAVGCAGNKDDAKDVLPQQKMEEVVWDIVQADEFMQNYVVKDSNKINIDSARYNLYEEVFRLHKISRDQFKKSYDYYASHPREAKLMFDSLSVRANKRIQEAYKDVQPQ